MELVALRLRSYYKDMVAGLNPMENIVVHAMEQKWRMMIVVIHVMKFVKHIEKKKAGEEQE